MNRRNFLNSMGLLAMQPLMSSLGVSLLSKVAQAQTSSRDARNLVIIRLHGAFDALQGLNPWLQEAPSKTDLSLAYDPQFNGEFGDYKSVLRNVKGTQINLGPSAHALAPFADKMAIVNGIWMGPSDLGHPFAIQYMTSGRAQEQAPSIAASLGGSRKNEDQFVIINGPIECGENELKILQTVNLVSGLPLPSKQGPSGFVGAYQRRGSHLNSHHAFTSNRERLENFNSIITSLRQSPKQVGAEGGLVPRLQTFADSEMDDVVAVASLSSGLSTVVQLDYSQNDGGNPDNHFGYNEIHPVAQRNRWDRLARFLGRLEKYRLMEKTLVLVLTEFTRTPALNSNGGKDHNYFDNSALLIGAGIKGGQVLGAHRLFGKDSSRSESQLSGEFVDFGGGTGEVYRTSIPLSEVRLENLPTGVDLIRPPDVLKTALEIVLPGLGSSLGGEAKVLPKIVLS